MRASEFISEQYLIDGFSLESSVSSVASDISAPVTQTYDALRSSAINWLDGHDDLKKWGFIAGGVEARMWWDKIWNPHLNPKKTAATGLLSHLYDLSKQSGRNGAELADLLNFMITKKISFRALGIALPPILIRLGKAIGQAKLVDRAEAWKSEAEKFSRFLLDLESSPPSVRNKRPKQAPPEPTPPDSKPKIPSAIPGQNVAAEKIVNDVLARLPSGVAGDIRKIINRSGNKIQALQAELSKRGLTP
jgi:hypothetical protein